MVSLCSRRFRAISGRAIRSPGRPIPRMPPLLEAFRGEFEKELVRPLVWDDRTKLWVGQVLTQALAEIHRTIRAAAPGKKVIYWHHGGYTYLDERGETLPADAPLAAKVLYPARWSDIVRPGLVDVLMGWPEHPKRFQRTLRLAERFNCAFFSQLSHPSRHAAQPLGGVVGQRQDSSPVEPGVLLLLRRGLQPRSTERRSFVLLGG